VLTRLLPVANAALERGRAAEPQMDERPQHAEDRHADDPSSGDAVQPGRQTSAAEHGRDEYEHDERDGRAMLVLDAGTGEAVHARTVTAQRMLAEGMIHFGLRNCQ